MSDAPAEAPGPNLTEGIPVSQLDAGGPLLGHVGDEPVLVIRSGGEVFAIGATCTHYGGPLAEGLIVGETVRCPWHHACFSLRTGEALRAPALRARRRAGASRRGTASCSSARSASASERRTSAAAARPPANRRHRRRRRRRQCRGGECCGARAMRGGSSWSAPTTHAPYDRPEPVEGLSGGQGAGGLDPAAFRRSSTRSTRIDLRLRTRGGGHRSREQARRSCRRHGGSMPYDALAPRDRRRAGAPRPSRAPTCRTSTICGRSPIAGRSSPRPGRRSARGRDRRELHRPRGRGLAPRARTRGARRRAGQRAAGARAGAASSATSSARCTRSTASRSTSDETAVAIDDATASR